MSYYYLRFSFYILCLIKCFIKLLKIMAVYFYRIPSKIFPFMFECARVHNLTAESIYLQFIIIDNTAKVIHIIMCCSHRGFPYLSFIGFTITKQTVNFSVYTVHPVSKTKP